MTSNIVVRRVVASPIRSASEAWDFIFDLLTASESTDLEELENTRSLCMSLVAAEAMKESPIVIYGVGPRLRIYCLYDEDAILGDDRSEDPLSWNPTDGDWAMSLPCPAEDLDWMQSALAYNSSRITVRDLNDTTPLVSERSNNRSDNNVGAVDKEVFLKS